MNKLLPSRSTIDVLQRELHIVSLLMNEKEIWNGESLAAFLSSDLQTDSGVDGKTVRVDLKNKIPNTLGIDIKTKNGGRCAVIGIEPDRETILKLLMVYTNFVVHDTSRLIAFNRLIERRGKLSLWLMARIHFATITKNKVRFSYTANDMKLRDVKMHPYYMIIQNNTLYLIGKREKDFTVGPYIFDRIDNLQVLDEKFDDNIPSPEDLFRHSHGVFTWSWSDATEVTIRYKRDKENSMIDEFSHLKPVIKRFADYFEMTFSVYDYESVCRQIFFYGKDVEIVSPLEVREHMIYMLRKSISVYKEQY